MDPGHLELADVGFVNLVERAIAPSAIVAVIFGPVSIDVLCETRCRGCGSHDCA